MANETIVWVFEWGALEGRHPCTHGEYEDGEGEQVANLAVEGDTLEDLRRHVATGPWEIFRLKPTPIAALNRGSDAKISHFHIKVLVELDVL